MLSYCPICGKPVYFAERRRSLGKDYHPLCLKCHHCKRQLTPGQHAEHDDKPYCTYCYLQRFGPRGKFKSWKPVACNRRGTLENRGTKAEYKQVVERARPSRLRSSFGPSSSSSSQVPAQI